jgi:hypothetical protein
MEFTVLQILEGVAWKMFFLGRVQNAGCVCLCKFQELAFFLLGDGSLEGEKKHDSLMSLKS